MTIIGEMHQQNGYSVLNTIIHKESHSCEKCGFILIFSKNRSFCQNCPQIFTLMQL